ncbi:MAG: 3-hydroxyacyl-ACP dehydratase [Chitinophagales bacterium]|nr:3-hydroxyacyl-ACP dehydratase [Chitinophagales bacterium]
MVDEVLLADPKASKTSFLIRDDNIFVKEGIFTEPGLVENMAQTAAAGTGYRYQQQGEHVPVGFIASIKNLRIYALPKTGDLLHTENIVAHTVMNVHVVEAVVYLGEQKIASCEMKIYEQSS